MKHITNLLTFAVMLECTAFLGICGTYEIGRIEAPELMKRLVITGAAIYITLRLIKVSAAVTANNSRRKRTVKQFPRLTVYSIPHNRKNVKPLRTNRNAI